MKLVKLIYTMSRIGKIPIEIPQGVEVTLNGNTVSVKGPKGELSQTFEPEFVTIKVEDNAVVVTRTNDSKSARARHGLYRSLTSNLIEGVTEGFSKTLEIKGVGYRAALKGSNLEMSLGFSHPIIFPIPESIVVTFHEKNNNILTLSGINKQLVGETAANIRKFRKPEPYKGKGIRYIDEYVRRKAGKSVAK